MCFESGKIPEPWRRAMIWPIYKGKGMDRRLTASYRRISLLSCIYKLFSSVINNRIKKFLEDGDLLAEEQNGFRQGRSCQDHVYILTSVIRNNLSSNKPIYTAFIDFKTAFDVVNRNFLLYKIIETGVNGKNVFYVINYIQSNGGLCTG